MSEEQVPEPIVAIDPAAMNAFEAEMTKRGVDLSLYDIELLATDTLYVVVTSYKKKPPRLRGSVPDFPDYEVEILRDDNRVHSVSIAR